MALLPAPAQVYADPCRVLTLPDGAVVTADPALRPAARWWRRVTEEAFGVDLVPLATAPVGGPCVRFALDPALPPGGYELAVDDTGVVVTAADRAGGHAAAQTLRQLAGPAAYRRAALAPGSSHEGASSVALSHVRIADHPRFAWRGVLLDVARHFLPKSDVLRFIDLAAMHKLNVVQLHLTDDQGWRIEIERYPRLTDIGSWRRESTVGTWRTGHGDGRPHGGFYTRADLAEMSTYARERGVTLVPEIDVPGHTEAAIAAYPWLGTSGTSHEVRTTWGISTRVLDPTPEAVAFFADVLDDVMAACDSPWIALGGDEVPTTSWREDSRIVARATALGFADVGDLHGWFLARLSDHVQAAGRQPIVWDEGLGPQLPAGTVVTAWHGKDVAAKALREGYDVVMAPEESTYLDHRAGDGPHEPIPVGFLRTTADIYAFEPLVTAPGSVVPDRAEEDEPASASAGVRSGRLLGVQAQVWTEHLDSMRRIDYAAFPRLAAFAEVAWSPAADRAIGSPTSAEFLTRLERDHLPRLDAYGVEYRPSIGAHPWQTRPGVAGYPLPRVTEEETAGAERGGGVDDRAEPRPGGAPSTS